jgi:hypothetical protein
VAPAIASQPQNVCLLLFDESDGIDWQMEDLSFELRQMDKPKFESLIHQLLLASLTSAVR